MVLLKQSVSQEEGSTGPQHQNQHQRLISETKPTETNE
jgi:hypothetical protein